MLLFFVLILFCLCSSLFLMSDKIELRNDHKDCFKTLSQMGIHKSNKFETPKVDHSSSS